MYPSSKQMKTTLQSIPPENMRYETVGDWEFLPGGHLKITTPNTLPQDSAFLVQLHELVEVYLCYKKGITDAEVTKWDKDHLDHEGEPGEIPGAPYFEEHAVANKVEAIVCDALGLSWEAHDDACGVADAEVTTRQALPPKPILGALWAELHLFSLRHKVGRNSTGWLNDWLQTWDYKSRAELAPILGENPPDWNDLFSWGVDIHNLYSIRFGGSTLDVENARELWSNRLF